MGVSKGLSVFKDFKVGGGGGESEGILPRENSNVQNVRNVSLGIPADLLRYYRYCDHNTHIPIKKSNKVQLSLKKADIASF